MPRTITIEVVADTKQFNSAIDGVKRKVTSALDPAPVKQFRSALDGVNTGLAQAARRAKDLGDTMSSIGRKLTIGLTAPLTALGVAAIKTATDFDSLRRGLIAVSGSSAAAEKQLVRLKEVAKLPGLGFREAIQGSINLQAAGFSAERAEKALRVFGNALATVGKGKAELDGVILALSQIETKGKVSAEEINQLAERVPQIRKAIVAAFGTADTEIIQKAKITSRQFIDAVTNELAKLPQVTGGARNAFENLKDSIEQSLLPLGNKLLETILPAIDRLSPKVLGLLEGFGKLSSGTQDLVIGFGAAALAAGPLITAVSSLTTAIVALNAASAGGLISRLLKGPVILTAAIVGTTAVQTFREATGNQEMIDRIGGPDLDKISRIMKQRGVSGADAFRTVAQELKDQALLAKLVEEQPGVRLPMSGAEAFRLFGGKPGPAIDAAALAAANAAAKSAKKSELDKAIDETKRMTELTAALRVSEGKLFEEEFKQLQLKIEQDQLIKQLKDRAFRAFLTAQGKPLPPQLPGGIGFSDEQRRGIQQQAARGFALREFAGPSDVARISREAADANAVETNRLRIDEAQQRLRIEEVRIANQVNAGLLTEAEARRALLGVQREQRDEIIARLEAQREAAGGNTLEVLRITEQIEQTRLLGVELSSAQRFMRGFGLATETVGDAFERLGQNVSRALTNTRDLLGGLKQAVLGFFNDLLGQSLQNLLRNVFAPLAGIFGGAAGGGSSSGGGVGGFFRQAFGGGGGGGGFQQLATAFAGGGGGLSAPPSISSPLGGINFFSGGGATSAITSSGSFLNILNPFATGGSSAAGAAASASKFSFGSFAKGIGQSLGAAAPFLGLGIGSSLGGQSGLGQVLGGAGGALLGGTIAATVAPSLFSPFLAAFLASPIGVIIGAGLLVGGIFAGRAKQRRQDEETAGQLLGQAFQAVEQLGAGIASDQIEGSQARAILESNIVSPFVQQINQLKTASVRRDWVKNQVPEIRGRFEANVVPLIAEQERRRADATRFSAIDRRLISQFAGGGVVSGVDRGFDSVRALLRPGEMVLTQAQQFNIARLAGADAFARAGVPGVQPQATFQTGGIVPAGSQEPMVINLAVQLGISEQDTQAILAHGINSRTGEDIIVNVVQRARGRGRNV